jgi:hypothetical protein
MQRYAIFFIALNAIHVLGGFPAIIRSSKTVHIPDAVCTVFELLMMGGETA